MDALKHRQPCKRPQHEEADGTSGMVAFWRAVVLRALQDGCGFFAGSVLPGSRATYRDRAREWFNGGEDYQMVCSFADLDPATVAKHAKRCFAEIDAGRVPECLATAEAHSVAQLERYRKAKLQFSEDRSCREADAMATAS